MTLGEELLQDQLDRLEEDQKELCARIVKANKALQAFRAQLRIAFDQRTPKKRREAMTIAHSIILNLDAAGGPLDVWQVGAGDTAIELYNAKVTGAAPTGGGKSDNG